MTAEAKKRPVIALTGASGYIGSNLLKKLINSFDIIALSRSGDKQENTEHVEWRSCDLFSQIDTEKGLKGADIAVYLVHSMRPSAKLTQAKFEDMDVILADNFAQAAKNNGVKQIVYLSGIIPPDEQLSRHLKSRLEVEKILRAYGVPVTTVRAGLIVGPKGSSFPIAEKLVKRLPVMVLPKWTRTKTHPIALADVMHALKESINNPDVKDKDIDIGGPEVMTYKEMMKRIAGVMGKRFRSVNVPFLTVNLSRLWVSVVTGNPKETVYPLIESLSHPMVAQQEHLVEGISNGKTSFDNAVKTAMEQEQEMASGSKKKKSKNKTQARPDVRSVQRMTLPEGKDANWAAIYYSKWLTQTGRPILNAEIDDHDNISIGFVLSKKPLLKLSYSKERSNGHRALYYITGGIFANAKESQQGRIEFRQIPNSNECIIAIHEYMPTLPWMIYKYTQAPLHLAVMYLFKKHIAHLIKEAKKGKQQPVNQHTLQAAN